jgi:hypothetical protein
LKNETVFTMFGLTNESNLFVIRAQNVPHLSYSCYAKLANMTNSARTSCMMKVALIRPIRHAGGPMLVKVSQAAQVLGLSIKTIERAIEAGQIVDHQHRSDAEKQAATKKRGPRFYLIDLAETRAYFERRGTLLRLPPPEGEKAIIHELLAENERLRKELARYTQLSATMRRDRIGPAAPVSPREELSPVVLEHIPTVQAVLPQGEEARFKHKGRTQRPNPLGLVLTFDNGIMSGHSIRKLGNAHGIRGETARQTWAEKMGDARRSRYAVLAWIQQRLQEQHLPSMFRCIDAECDCQQMDGEWRERTADEATEAMRLAPLPEAERNRMLRERQSENAERALDEETVLVDTP